MSLCNEVALGTVAVTELALTLVTLQPGDVTMVSTSSYIISLLDGHFHITNNKFNHIDS